VAALATIIIVSSSVRVMPLLPLTIVLERLICQMSVRARIAAIAMIPALGLLGNGAIVGSGAAGRNAKSHADTLAHEAESLNAEVRHTEVRRFLDDVQAA
jgi:hypothetical protein